MYTFIPSAHIQSREYELHIPSKANVPVNILLASMISFSVIMTFVITLAPSIREGVPVPVLISIWIVVIAFSVLAVYLIRDIVVDIRGYKKTETYRAHITVLIQSLSTCLGDTAVYGMLETETNTFTVLRQSSGKNASYILTVFEFTEGANTSSVLQEVAGYVNMSVYTVSAVVRDIIKTEWPLQLQLPVGSSRLIKVSSEHMSSSDDIRYNVPKPTTYATTGELSELTGFVNALVVS